MPRLLLLLMVVVLACGQKKGAIAELTKADGPVERQAGQAAWSAASIGTQFYLGDAAQTADAGAELKIVGGPARIAMKPHTILRFGGKVGAPKIAVESGAIDLTGTGSYALDIGDVKLSRNGTIRVTSTGPGTSAIELTFGEAQVSTVSGATIDLEIGKAVAIDFSNPTVTSMPDAAVAVAAQVDAAVADAAIDPGAEATIEVTGKRAEIQLAGEKKWAPLASGVVAKGAKVRLGTGTTAKLVAGATTLQLAGGSRFGVGDDLAIAIETGAITVSGEGSVELPGGALALHAAGEAKLEVGGQAKVTMAKGGAKLTGGPGTELELDRGESAALTKGGAIRVIEAIPTYFDFRVVAGETFTIHDPHPPTALQFRFGGKCPSGGVVELDRDGRFRTAKLSGGKESANMSIASGGWAYRLRCTTNGDEGAAVASGRIVVKQDDGRRPLPKVPPDNPIDADGRSWTISYQSQIPNLIVAYKGPAGGTAFRLHLAQGGADQTFDAKKPSVTVSGTKLREGSYVYWFDKDGVKQDKTVSKLKIDFDQTAPQVYIESPPDRKPWSGDIDVRGAVLPGWTAAVDVAIPVDKARRFSAKVGVPPGTALAIKLSHPQRGIHYYLRRAK